MNNNDNEIALEVARFEADLLQQMQFIAQLNSIDQLLEHELQLPSERKSKSVDATANLSAEDRWTIAAYCNRVRLLCANTLRQSSWALNARWYGEECLNRLKQIRQRLKLYRIQRYAHISDYSGTGAGRFWNLAIQLFTAECWLLLLRHRLLVLWRKLGVLPQTFVDPYAEKMTSADVQQLCDVDQVVAYGKKLWAGHAYSPASGTHLSQFEFAISMRTLVLMWHETSVSDSIERYLQWLLMEYVHLALLPNADRLDGYVNRDWRLNTQKQATCTAEFMANVAVQFTYMERDVLVVKALVRRLTAISSSTPIQDYLRIIWSSTKHSLSMDVRIRFIEWLRPQLTAMMRARNVTSFRDRVASMLLRPSEIEAYARQNEGIELNEFLTVTECTRSPQQVAWWTQRAFTNMIEYLNTNDVVALARKDRVRDLMMILIFHQLVQAKFNLDWWTYVVVYEYDIMACYESKLLWAKNPLMLLCGGHYIVYTNYNDTVQMRSYLHADEALAVWLQTMFEHQFVENVGLRFSTFNEGDFDLTELMSSCRHIFQ